MKPEMVRRTFKREVAVACLVILFGITGYSIFSDDPALVEARLQAVGMLAMPILLFVTAAFGLDAAAKQLNLGGRQQAYTPPYDPNQPVVPHEPPHYLGDEER